MISRTNMAILVVSVVIGVTTFILTRNAKGRPPTTTEAKLDAPPRRGQVDAMSRWLGLSQQQRDSIETQDPTFWREVIGQRQQLAQERDRLTRLLEDPNAADREITEQVERLITLGNEVERRVTKHLLVLRKHLTPDQQKRLFGLAASCVRRRMGWCNGCGYGQGRGQGQGRGWGQGRGRGRGGRGSVNTCCPDCGESTPCAHSGAVTAGTENNTTTSQRAVGPKTRSSETPRRGGGGRGHRGGRRPGR